MKKDYTIVYFKENFELTSQIKLTNKQIRRYKKLEDSQGYVNLDFMLLRIADKEEPELILNNYNEEEKKQIFDYYAEVLFECKWLSDNFDAFDMTDYDFKKMSLIVDEVLKDLNINPSYTCMICNPTDRVYFKDELSTTVEYDLNRLSLFNFI